MNSNRIIGPHTAIINNQSTGLAGCASSAACERAPHCLRAAPELAYRVTHRADGRCGSFIARATPPQSPSASGNVGEEK